MWTPRGARREPPSDLSRDDRAEVGISTMIVFIATVLVAAIAGAALLDTGVHLQAKTQKTGSDVSAHVSSNLLVNHIRGQRTLATDDLETLLIVISLHPGSSAIDLSLLKVQLKAESAITSFDYVNGTAGIGEFNTSEIRDADDSHDATTPVMNSGDLITIQIDLSANTMEMGERESFELSLIPEVGGEVQTDFTTPASFGNDLVVSLR